MSIQAVNKATLSNTSANAFSGKLEAFGSGQTYNYDVGKVRSSFALLRNAFEILATSNSYQGVELSDAQRDAFKTAHGKLINSISLLDNVIDTVQNGGEITKAVSQKLRDAFFYAREGAKAADGAGIKFEGKDTYYSAVENMIANARAGKAKKA